MRTIQLTLAVDTWLNDANFPLICHSRLRQLLPELEDATRCVMLLRNGPDDYPRDGSLGLFGFRVHDGVVVCRQENEPTIEGGSLAYYVTTRFADNVLEQSGCKVGDRFFVCFEEVQR